MKHEWIDEVQGLIEQEIGKPGVNEFFNLRTEK